MTNKEAYDLQEFAHLSYKGRQALYWGPDNAGKHAIVSVDENQSLDFHFVYCEEMEPISRFSFKKMAPGAPIPPTFKNHKDEAICFDEEASPDFFPYAHLESIIYIGDNGKEHHAIYLNDPIIEDIDCMELSSVASDYDYIIKKGEQLYIHHQVVVRRNGGLDVVYCGGKRLKKGAIRE